MAVVTAPQSDRRVARARGFTLVEVSLALVVLVVAALAHMMSVAAADQSDQATEAHGLALQTLERFVERMRGDPQWGTLFVRLATLGPTAESGDDPTLVKVTGDYGLRTVPATTYFSDFVVPSQLRNATFLVQVPCVMNAGTPELREDLNAPRYGLPYDLNGDGVVSSVPVNADYHQLPVVVRLRWGGLGADTPTEIVMSTWLRGDR